MPDEVLVGNFGTQVSSLGAHVTVKELEPSPSKRIGKHIGVLVEVLGDFTVLGVTDHSHVSRGHHRGDLLAGVFSVGSHVVLIGVLGRPLVSTGRALDEFPLVLVLEEQIEVSVVPLGRVGGPSTFDAAGDGVATVPLTVRAHPAETHVFNGPAFGLWANVCGVTCTVRFPEGVATSRQSNGLFVAHGHASKGLANILSAEQRIWVAVGPLRVHVNQTHLDSSKRVFQILTGIAVAVVAQPLVFSTPVDVGLGRPDVLPAAAESEHGPAHGFNRHVTGQDEKVSPRNLVAVLLLDWPEQASGLVEVAVVGPAVQRSKALCAGAATTTAVAGAVGACSMPGHADEEAAVVTVVGRPPVLAVGHEVVEILLQGSVIQRVEGILVAEPGVHGVGLPVVLVQDAQIELVGPPVVVVRSAVGRGCATVHDGALGIGVSEMLHGGQ